MLQEQKTTHKKQTTQIQQNKTSLV